MPSTCDVRPRRGDRDRLAQVGSVVSARTYGEVRSSADRSRSTVEVELYDEVTRAAEQVSAARVVRSGAECPPLRPPTLANHRFRRSRAPGYSAFAASNMSQW